MRGIKDILQSLLSLLLIIGLTTVLYLYTSGYRLSKDINNNIDISQTGMISAKSLPKSASVYLDEKLISATDDTISSIEPGIHKLKIAKKGFVEWEKDIEVFPELVTDITAILVAQSPRLEPLTNTGARAPIISPTLSKLAYFSSDKADPGIWVVALRGALNLFKSTPTVAIEDTRFTKYSEGIGIKWSPDETKLLVEGKNNNFYLVDLERNTAETTASPDTVLQSWQAQLIKKREDFIQKLELPEDIVQLAISPKTIWAPDDKKFLYTLQNGNVMEYRVYNLEKPIPIGEKIENTVFTTNVNDNQPAISWYADSFHLIMLEGDVEKDSKGVISLIRIDGTNKTEIYSNTLTSDSVFSSPDGEKVIILTSFKSGGQTDLYTVSIR